MKQMTRLPELPNSIFAFAVVIIIVLSTTVLSKTLRAAEPSSGTAQVSEDSLHLRINVTLEASLRGERVASSASDAEFTRRIYLDLVGRIPSISETRNVLADKSSNKRTALVDHLLASPEHARRMHELFHTILMERRAEDLHWTNYLRSSFLANRGWDKMVGDILTPDMDATESQGAAFFITSRLTKEGAMAPVDVPGLTRDVGRLLAGVDLQCAQCHDHINIEDYRQQDFQGLHMVFENIEMRRDSKFPAVTEKLVSQPKEYVSVFTQEKATTGVAVPGGPTIDVIKYEPGEEYLVPPDKKNRIP